MDKKIGRFLLPVVILLITILGLVAIFMFTNETEKYEYARLDKTLRNPYMGFAPSADCYDAVGENTLVYVGVTWREFEPEDGKYDVEEIWESNYLNEWRNKGKNVVLRFVCDYPSNEKHRDIPDWIYDITGDGTDYDCEYGKGYSPNYENETFIKYHNRAIKALAECFKRDFGDDFVFCVELGSLGHWGEWHVKYDEGIERFPAEEICKKYVEGYVEAFPDTMLLMRRPFSFVGKYDMGMFNDVAGSVWDTNEWLSWINNGGEYDEAKKNIVLLPAPKAYEKAAIGGELTSSLTLEEHLTTNLKENIIEVRKSHTTFLGPNCPIETEEFDDYRQQADELLKNMGYKYSVDSMRIVKNRFLGNMKVMITFANLGPAPLYKKIPITLYIVGKDGEIIKELQSVDGLDDIYDGKTKTISWKLKESEYNVMQQRLAIGMGIDFASDIANEDRIYFLN